MARDKTATHNKIVKVAKKLFIKKGYEAVSMRDLGEKVGVTQAALYRHFKNKEDMFASLVKPALDAIKEMVKEHEEYVKNRKSFNLNELLRHNTITIAKRVLKDYREEFYLLVMCSKGTKFENFVYDVIRYEQTSVNKLLIDMKEKGYPVKVVSVDELHVLFSAYIHAIFEPIVHNWSYEDSLNYLNIIENFFLPGWESVFKA